jgi:hypothetical protein
MIREYELDFAGWAEDMARAIQECRWSEIDRVAVSDEILGLSKSDALMVRAYRTARIEAANEAGSEIAAFPEVGEWKVESVLS